MIKSAPPMVGDFLSFFYDNIDAQGGFMVHAPKLAIVFSLATAGVKDLWDLVFPPA